MKMDKIIAIDPGPEQSAYVVWDGKEIFDKAIMINNHLLRLLRDLRTDINPLVIEQIQSLGMPVGKDVFETVFWIGRFYQQFHLVGDVERIIRMEVKMHICNDSRAKDSNIRQALIDRFGPPGTKKLPGLTYGLKKDLWQAFALAVVYSDLYINGKKA